MKAVFLCENVDTIGYIYPEKIQKNLKKTINLDKNVYTKADLESAKDNLQNVDIILSTWGMPCLSENEIARYFPSLKAVFYGAGTVQSFARPFLARGVKIFSAWAANAVPVAEFTVAQIILANKGYFSSRFFKNGSYYPTRDTVKTFPGSFDTKVGLIGCGMIGSLVANMLKNYRLQVMVFDPFLSEEKAEKLGVQKAGLEEIFSSCQTISNHLANNPQTVGMIDYSLFNLMSENAVFINTGRGAQVVEDDLIRALKECKNRTALLDVTEPEPPEDGSELYNMDNVILTPHIAGSMGQEVVRMGEYMAQELELFLSGKPTNFEVSEQMLETMA